MTCLALQVVLLDLIGVVICDSHKICKWITQVLAGDAGGTSNEHIHVGQPIHIRAPWQAWETGSESDSSCLKALACGDIGTGAMASPVDIATSVQSHLH